MVESTKPMLGTKKRVFRLRDKPSQILRVARDDTDNDHNVFKSFFQTVKREHILIEYNTPYLKILESDPLGPPGQPVKSVMVYPSI